MHNFIPQKKIMCIPHPGIIKRTESRITTLPETEIMSILPPKRKTEREKTLHLQAGKKKNRGSPHLRRLTEHIRLHLLLKRKRIITEDTITEGKNRWEAAATRRPERQINRKAELNGEKIDRGQGVLQKTLCGYDSCPDTECNHKFCLPA